MQSCCQEHSVWAWFIFCSLLLSPSKPWVGKTLFRSGALCLLLELLWLMTPVINTVKTLFLRLYSSFNVSTLIRSPVSFPYVPIWHRKHSGDCSCSTASPHPLRGLFEPVLYGMSGVIIKPTSARASGRIMLAWRWVWLENTVCVISAVNTFGGWQWPTTMNHRK